MARKELSVTIAAEGRDKGKVYHLTEMSAARAEAWATRAFLALARSGAEIPDDIEAAGFAGVASLGLRALAGVTFDDAQPLLAEMLTCVQVTPDPANPTFRRPLFGDDDVEEVATFVELRKAVFALHVDFSKAVALWKLRAAAATTDGETSENTETSLPLSE